MTQSRSWFVRSGVLFSLLLISFAAFGATFIVPTDEVMVEQADAIVVASALTSYPQMASYGDIETVTALSIEQVLKGSISQDSINVHEPGGTLNGRTKIIFGTPKFVDGERVLLFLTRTPQGTWAVTNLVLGKFTFHTDKAGRNLLVRQQADINGWDSKGNVFRETTRSANQFLSFVREKARGGEPTVSYAVSAEPVASHGVAAGAKFRTEANAASTSPTSYLMGGDAPPDLGGRWNSFPAATTFYTYNTAVNATAATAAVNAAFNAWVGDASSNVNLVNGGTDPNANAPTGLGGSDARNSIMFESNLTSRYGAPGFTCGGNSYSGLLGLGGISTFNTHSFAGETFGTIVEGDVEMNTNVLGCTFLINTGNLNSAVAHEVGHALGFRHADQNRNSTACTPSTTNECATSAIMTSTVTPSLNAALQTWDINAVRTVYPSAACANFAITGHPTSTSITAGNSTILSVSATGSNLSYQWYIGASGVTTTPINGAVASALQVSPGSTTTYWVRVSDACTSSSANSNAATVTVNASCASVGITSHPASLTITRGTSTTLSVTATGTSRTYQWYTNASGNTTAPINGATSTSLQVTPSATTWYWVRVTDACTGTSVNSNTAVVTVKSFVRGDFTGDGIGDGGLFRPSTATWRFSSGVNFAWGSVNDTPVQADYDGDRIADYATYRPSTGGWLIRYSTNTSTVNVTLGSTLDTPAPADYDGDGKADVAIFRKSTGLWTIKQSSNGATRTVQWGGSGGDIPVPSDYDGDGKADIAIFSQGTGGGGGLWYIILSANSGTRVVQWGGTGGDIPVPYDFDGDGKADVAIVSPVDGKWYMILSANNGTRVVQWGGSGGDQPVPTDWDGDGKADVAIFNPGPGQWLIITSSNGGTVVFTHGQAGDIAVAK